MARVGTFGTLARARAREVPILPIGGQTTVIAAPTVVALDGLLRPLGFHRKKYVWNRRNGYYVDVIDIQVSKARDSFTINAGVTETRVRDIVWGDVVKGDYVPEVNCIVRARVPRLVAKTERWWEVDSDEAPQDAVALVRDYAIPFLEGLHSLEALEAELVATGSISGSYPVSRFYVAVLRHQLGRHAEACDILAELSSLTWARSRAARVAHLLECQRPRSA